MREIKFRAWDEDNNCMVIGSTIKMMVISTPIPLSDRAADERYILMQYTGLKDKNGKEIYEGDIISFFNGSGHGIYETNIPIIFKDCNFAANNGLKNYWIGSPHMQNIRILGNIHEDPGLLK